jgi:hypothetical protein
MKTMNFNLKVAKKYKSSTLKTLLFKKNATILKKIFKNGIILH